VKSTIVPVATTKITPANILQFHEPQDNPTNRLSRTFIIAPKSLSNNIMAFSFQSIGRIKPFIKKNVDCNRMFISWCSDCDKTLSEFVILLGNYPCFTPVSTRLAGRALPFSFLN